jgi:UMF1 family MFS transporter
MEKRKILSWCLYDFANSSYSAVIAAVIFPVYYAGKVVGNSRGLGDLWWGNAISVSMLIVALSSPFMGGIADRGGIRKRFLIAYTALCVSAVAMFTTLEKGDVLSGFFLIVLANVGMEGAFTFCNSFLPDIAPKQFRGRVSGWGSAMGYAGSIVSLFMALPLVKKGLYQDVWIMVSAFFLLFSLPAFFLLPGDSPARGARPLRAARDGISQALRSLKELWVNNPASRRFLIAFLLYEDGVNTIIVFSSLFAAVSLGFAPEELVALYLLVQVTALAGALVMAKPTDMWGPKRVVMTALVLWTTVSAAAYFVDSKWHFWLIASLAGTGLGSIQAASRALFARFIPQGKESEYFGVYAMIGKTSAVLGPFVFGRLSAATGSQRPAVLAVGLFFLAGMLVLFPLKESDIDPSL